jgi:Flp pilus assembly secretin CpaC
MPVDLKKHVKPETPEKNVFRKKYMFPILYCGVIAMALWSGTAMVSSFGPNSGMPFSSIETAAGDEIKTDAIKNVAVSSDDLIGVNELPPIPAEPELADAPLAADATELPPLRISPDKPEVIQLDRDAINVLVGSDETLRAVPDTNRTIVLIPKKPGATYFKAIDADGKIIMQRHVIVGAPEKGNKYLRIRRACAGDDTNCKQYSVYYCPDMCHEVNVVQGEATSQKSVTPDIAPSVSSSEEYVEPAQ